MQARKSAPLARGGTLRGDKATGKVTVTPAAPTLMHYQSGLNWC